MSRSHPVRRAPWRRRRLRPALATAAVVAALLPVGIGVTGDFYQWTDEEGRTVFSDQPPPDDATGIELEAVPEGAEEEPGPWEGRHAQGDTDESAPDMDALCRDAVANAGRFLRERANRLVGADDPDVDFTQAIAEHGGVDPGEDFAPGDDEGQHTVQAALFAKALSRQFRQTPDTAIADCTAEIEAHEDIACMAEAHDLDAFEACDQSVLYP